MRSAFKLLGYLILLLLLAASIGSFLLGRPFLLEVEQTNSMYPLLQRGDVAVVLPLPASSVRVGTIILFRSRNGPLKSIPFVVHRIVGGNARLGYLTKGDHNSTTDQVAGATGRVPPSWIEGVVPTVGGQSLRVPLVGYLPLWAGEYLGHLYILPAAGAVLVLAVALSEHRAGPVRRRRRNHQDVLVVALVSSALVLSSLTAALILTTSQQEMAPYLVSHTTGVLNGSRVGILRQGSIVRVPAAHLYNTGLMPLAVTVVSTDPNAWFAPSSFWLPPGEQRLVTLTLRANGMGMHRAAIWAGLFPPLLPPGILWLLARHSFWLALVLVALMPALPFLAYLALAPRLRRSALRLGQRAIRPLARLLTIS